MTNLHLAGKYYLLFLKITLLPPPGGRLNIGQCYLGKMKRRKRKKENMKN
jgi:hypothetical protein